jgi:hypothetical protein
MRNQIKYIPTRLYTTKSNIFQRGTGVTQVLHWIPSITEMAFVVLRHNWRQVDAPKTEELIQQICELHNAKTEVFGGFELNEFASCVIEQSVRWQLLPLSGCVEVVELIVGKQQLSPHAMIQRCQFLCMRGYMSTPDPYESIMCFEIIS